MLTPDELAEIRQLASADFNGHLVIRLLDEYEKLIDPSKLEDVPPVDPTPWAKAVRGDRESDRMRTEMERFYRGDGWRWQP